MLIDYLLVVIEFISIMNLYVVFNSFANGKKDVSLIHAIVWNTFNVPLLLYGMYALIYNYNVRFTVIDIILYIIINALTIVVALRSLLTEHVSYTKDVKTK